MRKTPLDTSTREIEVLSSRFIAVLAPIFSFEDGEKVLAKMKEDYPSASHYCFAYCSEGKERCSDDGEPPKSAGLPLLELLRTNGISDAFLGVTRYFGGRKLGLGRLSRTYREAGEKIIKEASFAEIILGQEAEIEIDYSALRLWEYECERRGILIKEKNFSIVISLILEGDSKIMEEILQGDLPHKGIKSQKDKLIRRKI